MLIIRNVLTIMMTLNAAANLYRNGKRIKDERQEEKRQLNLEERHRVAFEEIE